MMYYRTWLRERAPFCMTWMFPKRQCCPHTDHQFYNNDNITAHCYHCKIMVPISVTNLPYRYEVTDG